MIDAGEVGARFSIVDAASPVLKAIAAQLGALQETLDRTQAKMRALMFPPGLMADITKLDDSLVGIGAAAEKGAEASRAAFAGIDESVAATTAAVARLRAEMAAIRPPGGRWPGGSRGTGGGGPRGPAQPPSGGASDRDHENALMAAVGIGGDAVWRVINAGGDLETQKKLLRDKLGFRGSESDIDQATGYAVRYATDPANGVFGSTPSENLKGIRELTSVMPDLKAAEEAYPQLMRAAQILSELSGGKKNAADILPNLAKGVELLGGGINPQTHELDPARMKEAVNAAVKTIVAGGGFIDDTAILGLAKQAGAMGRMTDPDKFYDAVITSVIDQGGNRTGTALSALGRQFLGNRMTVQTATELEHIGMLAPGSWKKAGGTGITMNPGQSIAGVDELQDPSKGVAAWMVDTVGPAIRAAVGNDNSALMQESYKIFDQATGQRLGLLFLQNEAQRKRDVDIKNGVNPDAAYSGLMGKDLGANLGNFGSAIKGFEEVVGGPNVASAISGLQGLSAGLHGLTDLLAQHQTAAKVVGEGASTFNLFGAALTAVKDIYNHLPSWPSSGGGAPTPHNRDPRSPSTGPYAYVPPAAPVSVSVTVPLTGQATVNVTNNVNVMGLVSQILSSVKGEIEGAFRRLGAQGTNGDSGHDGRSSPTYPDHMHGPH